ncbi:MAG TPA: AAA family ATPase, partial [Polyangiaceae bacterium]
DDDALVLTGRCGERESVPYKAVDGLIDVASKHLSRLSNAEARHLRPMNAALLAQVFPVLRRVEAFAQAPPPMNAALDPHEVRRRVFAAARELLARFTSGHRVVLAIDDFQWVDADSLAMLAEVLRPPDAPPLLMVVTARNAGSGDVGARLASLGIGASVRRLELGPLTESESRTLAQSLWEGAAETAYDVPERLLAEASGHPLFIDVLVRNAAFDRAEARVPRGLDAAMLDRIRALEEPQSTLLYLMSLSIRPLTAEALARAASVEVGGAMRALAALRADNLARTVAIEQVTAVEPYHDRVREVALSSLDPARRAECHERIALALEALDGDALEALAHHWSGAGDGARALRYTLRAAEHAGDALAFDQAARLYRRALDDLMTGAAGHTDDATIDATRVKLAHALANAGRGYEAASEYQAAAAHATSSAQALDLSWRAAAQLLQSGHIDESAAAVLVVLRSVGLPSPSTPVGLLVSLLYLRLLLWFRGMGYAERDESQISARELTRLDVCWAVSLGMTMVDMIRGFDFSTRYLLLALRAGEPLRILRGVCMEMVSIGGDGAKTRKRIARLEELAHSIAGRIKSPDARAWVLVGTGSAAYMVGDFRRSLEMCSQAERVFREECVGAIWELNTTQHMVLHSLAVLGELKTHAELHAQWRRSAMDRGDLYADTNLRIGDASYPLLAADQAHEVKADVAVAMKRWSTRGFHLEHYNELFAQMSADLYLGDYELAYEQIRAKWPLMRRSLLLQIELLRIFGWQLWGRAAVAAAQSRPDLAAERLKDAARAATQLERLKSTWGGPMAVLLRAAIAHRQRRAADAVLLLEEAEKGFSAADMLLQAVAARRMRGGVLGGDEGKLLVVQANAWAEEQTVKNPTRMFAVFAPGFDDVL